MMRLNSESISYTAKDLSFSNSSNSIQLDQCLERKEFETIIKDPYLFWLAYCKAIFPHQNKKETLVSIAIEDKNIKYSGNKLVIEQTQEMIEEIRKVFLEGLENKKSSEILVIKSGFECYFRKASSFIDLSHTLNGYVESWYHNFVKPALPGLAELCGALYIEDKKNQLIQKCDLFPAKIESVDVIRINWQDESHRVYPILPKPIPEQQEMGKALYSLYQNQQFCDFSVISKDNVIKVHSSLLYVYGGPVLQKLLTSEMKETLDKTISFAEYSQNTVQAFIEFIYLGGKAFSEKVISANNQDTINLFELFEFARTYQVEILVDCCTNLISLVATKKDLEVIKYLADLYDNKHLKLLCEYLLPKEKITFIKV